MTCAQYRIVGIDDEFAYADSGSVHDTVVGLSIEAWAVEPLIDGDLFLPEYTMKDGDAYTFEVLSDGVTDTWEVTWHQVGCPDPEREWWDQSTPGRISAQRIDTSAPALVLVSCGAAKRSDPTRADELYTGSLFRAHMTLARRYQAPIEILSAEHHLVELPTVIEPYDTTLTKMAKDQRDSWNADVAALVRARVPHGSSIVVLAGVEYTKWKHLARGIEVLEPLARKTLGDRVSMAADPQVDEPRRVSRARKIRWDFFFTTYRSSLKGMAIDEHWKHGAWYGILQLPEDLTLTEAISEARMLGLFGKGSTRSGVFEVQNERGVWSHPKGFYNIGLCKPTHVEFKSWADLEAEELAA